MAERKNGHMALTMDVRGNWFAGMVDFKCVMNLNPNSSLGSQEDHHRLIDGNLWPEDREGVVS